MPKLILGIETSCDETGCAIVSSELRVLSNPLYSQVDEHAAWGGVVPEIASRSHLEKVVPVTRAAFAEAGIQPSDIAVVAHTRGPGLMGPLLVGASFARGLARSLGIPAFGVNHLEGHIAAVHLSHPELQPPYLALTVSGGHTELIRVDPGFRYTLMGRTRDDAAGEAFDKCGKILGLDYPAGASISKLSAKGNPAFVRFPRGLHADGTADFSFSGLKTAVSRWVKDFPAEQLAAVMPDVCASLQEAIVASLVAKSMHALDACGLRAMVLCGGVSANRRLREALVGSCGSKGARLYVPDFQYCTDNGAMIAAAAWLRIRAGFGPCGPDVKPWLPLAD